MYFRTLCPETNDFAGMAEKDKQMIVRRYQRFETPSSHNPITQYHAMGSPFLLLCWAASVPFHGIDPSQSTAATSAIEVLGPVPGDGAPLCVPRPVVGTGLRGKGPLVAGDGDGDGLPVGNRRPGGGEVTSLSWEDGNGEETGTSTTTKKNRKSRWRNHSLKNKTRPGATGETMGAGHGRALSTK